MAVRYAVCARESTIWMTEEELREWLDTWFSGDQRPHAFHLSRVQVVEERG